MLCYRHSNVQVIFTVLLDVGKQAAAAHFGSHTPFSSNPSWQTRGEVIAFKPAPLLLGCPDSPLLPVRRAGRSLPTATERAPHGSLPPAPCLLGISQATAGGLGAVMLLNTSISKSELKHIKSALTGGFFFFKPLKKHLRNTARKQHQNWQHSKQNSRVYLHIAACLLLQITGCRAASYSLPNWVPV